MVSSVGKHHPGWEDMLRYVVHFTKPTGFGAAARSPYDNMMGILSSGRIEARNRFGLAKSNAHSPKASCFSEMPLHQIKRLADQRQSDYAVGFKKELIVSLGGGPILYAYEGSCHLNALLDLVSSADTEDDPIWSIAPFVDRVVPGYQFEWEREWRLSSDLRFDVNDVAFMVLPEAQHEDAAAFFADAGSEGLGPAYKVKMIDPRWSQAQVKKVIHW